jgi:S1-C subfamily serine protease
VLNAFNPDHVQGLSTAIPVGHAVSIIGYPMGFHDTVHHLPVVRQAAIASSYGLRFEGHGFFLTDGRMHRGSSGAPVLIRTPDASGWMLLGVHSSRFDVDNREKEEDESLGLNCAWYADVLLALTKD